mmetsp:Transcript_7061/g.21946  ORF Transcript_7061/g.21946 Transcript_7061/m.21946 type:complete len:95 (-) Transcript_7061:197-481(-)
MRLLPRSVPLLSLSLVLFLICFRLDTVFSSPSSSSEKEVDDDDDEEEEEAEIPNIQVAEPRHQRKQQNAKPPKESKEKKTRIWKESCPFWPACR